MKTTRNIDQNYTVTGHTKAGDLVQYAVNKDRGSGWTVHLVYGQGIQFPELYRTKAAAIKAINNQ